MNQPDPALVGRANVGSRAALDALIREIEYAYDGDPKHSFIANLAAFKDDEWTVYLPHAGRCLADIVEHVAWVKWMYEDYAFGSQSLAGDRPPLAPEGGARSRPRLALMAFLAEGHARLLGSVRRLVDDEDLERPRRAYWGGMLPARDIVHINLAHDLYHAGEINHLRALLQGTDQWPDDPPKT